MLDTLQRTIHMLRRQMVLQKLAIDDPALSYTTRPKGRRHGR